MIKSKTWAIILFVYVTLLFLLVSCITGIIDPFFHYHAPLESLQYPIEEARYQNDGIVRHFDYDALIAGTSMADNFRTSELDLLFNTNSIKVSTSGGASSEIMQTLQTALQSNPDIKMVLLAFDSWFASDFLAGENPVDGVPYYLYDKNPFNDVNYLLNKEVLFSKSLGVLYYTEQGNLTTSFDDYSSWRNYPFGKEVTLEHYFRPEKTEGSQVATEDYLSAVERVITENFVSLVQEYPDVTFYCYFPPYSALYWDRLNQYGYVETDVNIFRSVSHALLQAENLRLYSFHDDYEITTDLNHYRDEHHYSGEINSRILQKIHAGEHQLTLDNYDKYWDDLLSFYKEFDFNSLFQ